MTGQMLLRSHLKSARLIGTTMPVPGTYIGPLQVQLERPGPCSGEHICYHCVFDNSGSIGHGNDPGGNRFEEIRLTLRHVARHCRCHRELASIIHFDTPTSADVMPTKLDRKGLRQLEAGLTIPLDGAGSSDLGPSLDRVSALAAKQPDFKHVLTVLSDFELHGRPTVLDELVRFPGDVHAVVLRSTPPQVLIDAPTVLVTRVQPTDPPGAVAKALFTSMSLHRRPRRQRPLREKEVLEW